LNTTFSAVLPTALTTLANDQVLTAEQLADLSHEIYLSEIWRTLAVTNTTFRDYRLLYENDSVEAWVLSWMPGQITGFHDHDISSVGICVAHGTLLERHLRLHEAPHAHILRPGQTQAGGLGYIHEVSHLDGAPAISIHCYSPRLEQVGQYRVDEQGLLRRYPGHGRTTRLA
jgi:predicted metal-dependent enzyme (double-stranded beta helix superfamily)